MSTPLKAAVSSILRARTFDGDRAWSALKIADRDNKITPAEAEQLERLARGIDDKFSKGYRSKGPSDFNDPRYIADIIRFTADPAKELLGAALKLTSRVPGIELQLENVMRMENVPRPGRHLVSALNTRALHVVTHGERAAKGGALTFTFGKLAVDVAVKKGATMASIVRAVARSLREQLGGDLGVVHGGATRNGAATTTLFLSAAHAKKPPRVVHVTYPDPNNPLKAVVTDG